MNQYPLIHSKAALIAWVLVFLGSLYPLGWLIIHHGRPIPQILIVNTISLWMVLSHSRVYRPLKRWHLQFLPEILRWILFISVGYMLVNWFV